MLPMLCIVSHDHICCSVWLSLFLITDAVTMVGACPCLACAVFCYAGTLWLQSLGLQQEQGWLSSQCGQVITFSLQELSRTGVNVLCMRCAFFGDASCAVGLRPSCMLQATSSQRRSSARLTSVGVTLLMMHRSADAKFVPSESPTCSRSLLRMRAPKIGTLNLWVGGSGEEIGVGLPRG